MAYIVATEGEKLSRVAELLAGPAGSRRVVLYCRTAARAAAVADGLAPLDAVTCRRIADLLTRLLLSYALNAPDDPPEVVAAVLADVIVDGAASLIGKADEPTEDQR